MTVIVNSDYSNKIGSILSAKMTKHVIKMIFAKTGLMEQWSKIKKE